MGSCPTDLSVLAEQRGKTGAFVARAGAAGQRGAAAAAAGNSSGGKVRFAVPGMAGHALEASARL